MLGATHNHRRFMTGSSWLPAQFSSSFRQRLLFSPAAPGIDRMRCAALYTLATRRASRQLWRSDGRDMHGTQIVTMIP